MGHAYKAIQWTPFKKAFDAVLAGGVAVFVGAFVVAALLGAPAGQSPSEIQLILRALGACAFALLTLNLAIGPMARFSPRFKPLLYNRRHLGVTCFLIALAHAGLVILWYHGFSDQNPLISVLTSNPRYDSIGGFPFESLGVLALFVLFAMAATSHDFWNNNLGPGAWKALHMGVYVAYAALVAHVVLGAVQADKGWTYPTMVGLSAAAVAGLHIASGFREAGRDLRPAPARALDGWLEAGRAVDIPDGRAVIVTPPSGERIAVFRDGRKIHALANRCRHQGGPLGEGRIIDGCVTCPWHGFQYRPEDGCAPPPYTERTNAYRTTVVDGVVFVDPVPQPLGAPVAPGLIPEEAAG